MDEVGDLSSMDLVAFNGGVTPYGDRFLDGAFHMGAAFYRSTVEKWGFVGKGDVADIGSGFGRWSMFLAEVNDRVCGFDRLAGAVELSRKLADYFDLTNARFEVTDVTALPVADGAFDAIWCYNALQFVDRGKTLREAQRVLKSGGDLFVGHYNAAGRVLEKFFEGYAAGGLSNPTAKFALRSLRQGPGFNDANGTYGSEVHLGAVLTEFGFALSPTHPPELQTSPKAPPTNPFSEPMRDLQTLAERLETEPDFAAEFARQPQVAYTLPMNLAFRAVKV
jgi:SAM-dependent methyltransferase